MQLDLSFLPNGEAMEMLGQYIDQASDTSDLEMAKNAIKLCEDLALRVSGLLAVELCYFRANAWSVIRNLNHRDDSLIWKWNQDEMLQEIYWLRSAVQHECFVELELLRQSQILVNTGNVLNHIGRPIEAIEYWKRALSTLPKFAMAMGNLGSGYENYAKLLFDSNDQIIILKKAYDLMVATEKNCIWDNPNFKSAQQHFLRKALVISEHIDINAIAKVSLDSECLGKTKKEKEYRRWILNNTLFLNPLNEVGTHSIAAKDTLHLPSMVVDIGTPPSLLGFYNQIKQEFVTARYLFWEGNLSAGNYKTHFSDKDTQLVNTLDYPVYGLSIEKIKIAFRMAYSIFDKIAFFINEYWKLNIPNHKVYFHSVWVDRGENAVREFFSEYPNLPLRGLYWLSKEFSYKDNGSDLALGKVMEPDADNLRKIRNHLEHNYLKIHDDMWAYGKEHESSLFSDSLAHHLTLTELTEKTLRLLKRSREALIYLSLAVHQEERVKNETRTGRAMSMTLPYLE